MGSEWHVAALVPKAELEGEMGDSQMALQACLMSKALCKLTHSLNSAQTVLIFLNQTRHKLSTFGGMPSEVTAGGNALKFYALVCLNIKRKSQFKHGDEVLFWTCLYIVQVPYSRFFPHFRIYIKAK
jgi:recombination protein RecA